MNQFFLKNGENNFHYFKRYIHFLIYSSKNKLIKLLLIIFKRSNLFNTKEYKVWRTKRVKKIENLYGDNFFEGISVLELGCGKGLIGNLLTKKGAKVTLTEGRQEYLEDIKKLNSSSEVLYLDQNIEWNLRKKFDVVIHWGVLYHLDNWRQDLKCALKHGNLIFLESEVCDSDNCDFELKIQEFDYYDQSLNGIGSRPSANNIEKHLVQLGAHFKRFDDKDLSSNHHIYDWKVKNTNRWKNGLCRFWIIEK